MGHDDGRKGKIRKGLTELKCMEEHEMRADTLQTERAAYCWATDAVSPQK